MYGTASEDSVVPGVALTAGAANRGCMSVDVMEDDRYE